MTKLRKPAPLLMNPTLTKFEVRFADNGKLRLYRDGEQEDTLFDSILDVLKHVAADRQRGQNRMTLYGNDGRKIVETFV